MMQSAVTSPRPADTFDPLARTIETDRIYFALGASIVRFEGAEIVSLPEFSDDPAATVVQRIAADALSSIDAGWLARLERILGRLAAPLARIYLDSPRTVADKHLAAAGYQAREEIAFFGFTDAPQASTCQLRPVVTDAHWQAKLSFHEAAGQRADGYVSTAAEWTRMERYRCETGGMDAFLCVMGDNVVGAINIIDDGQVIRVKNVVTHPAWRRSGVASAMLSHLSDIAVSRGRKGICLFAFAGGDGEKLYTRAGLQPVGAQVEWSKNLGDHG